MTLIVCTHAVLAMCACTSIYMYACMRAIFLSLLGVDGG